MEIRMSVSNNLKEYRKKYNLTQETFAEKFNISAKTIAQWEQCKAEVPMEIILELRNGLHKSIDEIYNLGSIENTFSCFKEKLNYLKQIYIQESLKTINILDETSFKNSVNLNEEKIIFELYFDTIFSAYDFTLKNGRATFELNKENDDFDIINFLYKHGLVEVEQYFDADYEAHNIFILDNELAKYVIKEQIIEQNDYLNSHKGDGKTAAFTKERLENNKKILEALK